MPPEQNQSEPNQQPHSWTNRVNTNDGNIVRRGMVFVFGFIAVFFGWSLLFPISSAVIATGQLVSDGQNKLVQPNAAGVIRSIDVVEGQTVAKGDALFVLDASSAQGEFTQLSARYRKLQAQKARLTAQQSQDLAYSTVTGLGLRGGNGPVLAPGSSGTTLIDEQSREFAFGQKRRKAELQAARLRIEVLRARQAGLEMRMIHQNEAVERTAEQIAKIKPLVKSRYVAKSRLWELEEKRLEQQTAADNALSEVDAIEQEIAEAQSEVRRLASADKEKITQELTEVLAEMAEIKDQINAARTKVELSTVRAPVSGTITNIGVHTVGGVVAAGDVLGEIVPGKNVLVAEVRIAPDDINSVRNGQKGRVVLTALNQRLVDPVPATVTYVSADTTADKDTGESFFTARMALDEANLPDNVAARLVSGMKTDVFIESEARVFMSYLLTPIYDSFGRAFRE